VRLINTIYRQIIRYRNRDGDTDASLYFTTDNGRYQHLWSPKKCALLL